MRKNVEVIVACCQHAVDAAQKAANTIPIVVAVTANYAGQGFAKYLRRPGGNLIGLSAINPRIVRKQLELFKKVVPNLLRVAVLWNTAHRGHLSIARQANAAAVVLGLQLVVIRVRGPDEFVSAFRRMTAYWE